MIGCPGFRGDTAERPFPRFFLDTLARRGRKIGGWIAMFYRIYPRIVWEGWRSSEG